MSAGNGTLKRKAATSPTPSEADLEVELPYDDSRLSPTAASSPSPSKRSAVYKATQQASALQKLPQDVIAEFLPVQKRRCLDIFSSQVPAQTQANAPTNGDSKGAECIGMQEEWHTLHTMLHATVTAQESNSCLLIGSSGAGKSLLLDSVLRSLRGSAEPTQPFYQVTLSGTVQINDRAAMKEMAQQLILQGAFSEEDVGTQMTSQLDEDDDDLEEEDVKLSSLGRGDDQVFGGDEEDESEGELDEEAAVQEVLAGAILSSLNNVIAHIIALLSNASSSASGEGSKKPLVIVLKDFDLFTARPRQALLYCLLDAVQAASYGAGLAVVGVTSRVDTTDLLEKRVKSRFSHRIIHVRPPASFEVFENIIRAALTDSPAVASPQRTDREGQFQKAWESDISSLLAIGHIKDVLRGIYELSNDLRMVYRIMTVAISQLSATSPSPAGPRCVETILQSASIEVGDGMLRVLSDLTEPEMTLLIAVKHLQTRDRQIFNFEMVFDELRRFASRDARERQAASTGNSNSSLTALAGTVGAQGAAGPLSGSAVSTPFYADRKIALMSFHSLLGLEILLPENHVTTLSISNPVAKPSAAPSATSQTGRANQNTIRKDFWKVRCILSPPLILQAVKDRSRPIALNSSLVKWAASHG